MMTTLQKALIALVPTILLTVWASVVFVRTRQLFAVLQLFGAGCLLIVVVTHICEALGVLPVMHWGEPHSVGHYVDLMSAVTGVLLLVVARVLRAREKRHT